MRRTTPQWKVYGTSTTTVLLVALATVVGMSGLAMAQSQGNQGPPSSSPGEAEVTVDWHLDNMGFNVTSTHDLSNVIVEFCPTEEGDRRAHKHEDLFEEEDIREWSHRENETVIAIWVKSGDNHNPNDPEPPEPFDNQGAGEYIENEDAVCPHDPDPHPEPECHPTVSASAEEGPTNRVNWTDLEEAESFNVYRSVEGGPYELIHVTGPDTHEYEDTNVTIGNTYTYTVTATFNEDQETEPCNEATVTAIPVFPTVLAAGAASVLGIGAYAAAKRRS